MNDGIGILGVVESDALMFGSDPKTSKNTASRGMRMHHVKTLTKRSLKEGKVLKPVTAMKAVKKKYGQGLDFYVTKSLIAEATTEVKAVAAEKAKKQPAKAAKGKKISRNHKVKVPRKMSSYSTREKFTKKMLTKQPDMSHVELNKLAVRKHGREISDTLFKKYSGVAEKKTVESSRTVGVKASLKLHTVSLKDEIPNMSQFFLDCGVEKAQMTVVDGVPKWKLTQSIDRIVTEKRELSY